MASWGWVLKLRGLMTGLTDLLLKGRQAGLWQEGSGYIPPEKPLDYTRKH
jgi:hypothetical protein